VGEGDDVAVAVGGEVGARVDVGTGVIVGEGVCVAGAVGDVVGDAEGRSIVAVAVAVFFGGTVGVADAQAAAARPVSKIVI